MKLHISKVSEEELDTWAPVEGTFIIEGMATLEAYQLDEKISEMLSTDDWEVKVEVFDDAGREFQDGFIPTSGQFLATKI